MATQTSTYHQHVSRMIRRGKQPLAREAWQRSRRAVKAEHRKAAELVELAERGDSQAAAELIETGA